MKTILKNTVLVLFLFLAVGNIYIFASGMLLGEEINKYEIGTKKLMNENERLESEVYKLESLQYASSLSSSLSFTKKSQPVYFDNLKYALNR